jgi:hypothetical protein
VAVCRNNRSDDASAQMTSCGGNGKKWNVSGRHYRIVVEEHRGENESALVSARQVLLPISSVPSRIWPV